MNLIKCIHTNSKCYKVHQPAQMKGIVVHSTGANNKNLARYVQPSTTDSNYAYLINQIGKNRYGNHWNRSIDKAVHYMIGVRANGDVATAQTLPEDICAWGVGKGSKGSYNYNPTAHIQFEVLEDNLTDKTYFEKVYKEAVELCADICKRYKWDPTVIVSHKECSKLGYGSSHADIDHWLAKFGKNMNDFRADVTEVLSGKSLPTSEYRIHTVVKGESLWIISKKYLGSGFKYNKIKELNGLKSNTIYAGQKLKIPNK